MAISYLGVSFQSRSKGHKAVAGAAYRAGEALYDERYAMGHDYEGRGDVQHSEILLPKGADVRFSDREFLWNAVEFSENRKDSQVAIDYVLALPRELSLENQKSLARDFAQYHFVDKGLVVDIAIHDKGDGNPHAHLYTTTRRLLGDKFDRLKARDLMPKIKNGYLIPEEEHIWNEKYRAFQEKYFKAQDLTLYVDPNHLIPMRHEGRIASEDESHYLRDDNALRQARCVEIALHDPEALLNTLSEKQAVFNEKEIAKIINKYTESAEDFQHAMARVLAHEDCVSLGIGADGRETYTSRQNYLREATMADQASGLFARDNHDVSNRHVSKAIRSRSLSSEQESALHHLAKTGDVAALVGRAGTGKSYLMGAAREMWEAQGYRVSGVAVSGIAAKSLADETGMPTLTIHGLKQKHVRGKFPALNNNDVLIVDEAGMVSTQDMAELVAMSHTAGAKLVLVGDPDQLQPVSPGAPFRALASRVGFVSMDAIRRQSHVADRQASVALSQGNVADAINHYSRKNAVHFIKDAASGSAPSQVGGLSSDASLVDDRGTSYQRVVDDWFTSHGDHVGLAIGKDKLVQPASDKAGSQLMLAHRNADVAALNQLAREQLIASNKLSPEGVVVSAKRHKETVSLTLTPGDRIVFLRNNAEMGVKNGQFASVLSITGDQLNVQLDGQKQAFSFSANDYADFDYGYAATVHKTQGVTLDKAFVYAGGKGWNRRLAYVALTRHRESVQLYASSLDHAGPDELTQHFSREEYRDNVLDFPLSYAAHRGFDQEESAKGFVAKVMGASARIKDAWLFVTNYEAFVKQQIDKREANKFDSLKTTRQIAKASAGYIDMMRSLQQDRYALSQALSGKAFFSDPRYAKLVERQRALDGMAAQLWQHKDQLGDVFARNRYSLEKLQKAVLSHERFSRVDAYVSGFVSGQRARCLKEAPFIASEIKPHFTALSHACDSRGIDLKIVQRQLILDARQTERTQLLRVSSPTEKAALYTVERYFSTQDSSKALWRGIYTRDDNPAPREQQRLTMLSIQQDKLANIIVSDVSAHLPALALYGIDTDKLVDQKVKHSRRESVKQLEQLTFLVDRREHAHALLQDRANFKFIYERKADWKELGQLSRSYEHAQFLKSLTSDERKSYEQVAHYQRARVDAAKCWSQYFDLKAKDRPELEPVLKHAQNFTQKRDAFAYALVLNQAETAPFIGKIKCSVSDIKKQAKRHLDALAKQQGKIPTKSHQPNHTQVQQPSTGAKMVERLDADTVNQALVSMGEDFYSQVIGEDGKRSAGKIRFGQKGSLSVTLNGLHSGSWHSFETDEGGYPLQLLMNSTHGWGLSFKEALQEGARIAGVSPEKVRLPDLAAKRQAEKARSAKKEISQTKDAERIKQRIAAARYYWGSAKPIAGTLGEKYLREIRKIPGDLSSFRFHPRIKDPSTKQYYPGIVVAAASQHRELKASQTILLGPDGNKAPKENGLDVIKRSRGVVKGAAVLIHKGKVEGKQQVVIAEGPETAASLITALPDAHIYVTLGNISNAKSLYWLSEKHKTKQFYFAADNDGVNGESINKIKSIASTLKYKHGIDCYMAKPHLPGKGLQDKVDFNDVLIAQGVEGVKKQVAHFDKVFVPEKKILIDEKTIDASFMPPKEDWDKIAEAWQYDFKGLSKSYMTMNNSKYSQELRGISKQNFDRYVESIYLSEPSFNSLSKLSPNIAKLVKAQGDATSGLKIKWQDKAYKAEWEALRKIDNEPIKSLIKAYDDFANDKTSAFAKVHEKTLNQKALSLSEKKDAFTKLQKIAPKLGAQIKARRDREIERDRGMDR
jgi:Ti-type conjugative transfer relaxase TraA